MKRKGIIVSTGRPYPLGMTAIGEKEINLAAVLQTKEECGVILCPKNGRTPIRIPFPREGHTGGIRCMKLSGIGAEDCSYRFYAGEEEMADPYARRILGNETWGEKTDPVLSGAAGARDFDWEGDAPLKKPLCDSFLYQLHVRGFTKHASSGVKKKGTFAGIVEKIPYLKTLGVTAIEMMPVYEFVELQSEKPAGTIPMQESVLRHRGMDLPEQEARPRINYWGFKEGYYFSPKASYAAGADPGAEFKQMVKQLHKNGLEVILQFYFPGRTRPGLILDVVRFWVEEYHIDGVHLLGEKIPMTLIATDPMLTETKLIGRDLDCREIYSDQETPACKNLACFSEDFLYDMRRFLKGDEDMLHSVLYQLRKNPKQAGAINFLTNYEGFSLADLVSYERKHNEENGEENRDGNPYNASWNCGAEGPTKKRGILKLRRKQMRNAMLLLLFAQGTPMIVAGDEFGFSRGGNNNAWCQDNEVNWLNWKLNADNRRFLEFVREAVALRMAHPILHRPDELTMMDYIACGCPDLSYHGQEAWQVSYDRISREVGVLYCGRYARIDRKQEDDYFYIAYNMHWEEKEMALPILPGGLGWEIALDSALDPADREKAMEQEEKPVERSLLSGRTAIVKERSILILKSCKIAG